LTRFLLLLALWAAPAAFSQVDLAAVSHQAKRALEQGRYDEAVRLYRDLARALPRHPGMRMNLGLALHSAGRWREAAAEFSAVLKLDPSSTAAKILLGVDYQKLGEPAKAVASLEEALRADPTNRIALVQLASSHLALSHQAFEELQKEAPGSAYVLMLQAESLAEQHRYRNAFHLYRQALAADPNLPGVHAALAAVYRATGHQEWARVEEQRERQLPAGRASDSSRAARLYQESRHHSEMARAAFQRLSELGPSAELHQLRAEADHIQGRYTEEASEYREALRLDPGNLTLEEGLATALWLDHDCAAAEPLLKKLAAQRPRSAELVFELGDCLLQQQQVEQAIPWLEQAAKAQPSLLAARAALGRAYLRSGDTARAIDHLEAALPMDEDGSLHYQLARAYQRVGRADKAAEAMREYESIARRNAERQQRRQQMAITPP
jgi:tetratricopeptide (TPR) repeat protein